MGKMWPGKPYKPRAKRRFHWGRIWLILPLALFLLALAEYQLAPVIRTAAQQQAHNLTLAAMTEAINAQTTDFAAANNYQQLMHVERDSTGRVTLLIPDTLVLNQLISATTLDITERLNILGQQQLSLPLGSLTGSSILADMGPEIHFGFRAHGAPTVLVEEEFTDAGVNQVRHSIYLKVESELRVYVPLNNSTTTVSTTMLLAEGVIVGYTPDTYVNIEK